MTAATPGRLPRIGDPDRRTRAALLAVLFVLSLFAGRLFQLQGLDAAELAADAQGYRLKDEVLPAQRGDILAADGSVLATTVTRHDVTVDQTLVAEYARVVGGDREVVGPAAAAELLAPALGMSELDVAAALTGDKRFAYVARQVTPEVWREVNRVARENGIPGILAEDASERVYPAGAVAGSLTGFLGSDGTPLGGLESVFDTSLTGTEGHRRYEVAADQTPIPMGVSSTTDPVPGKSVRLTIDRDLQWKAQQALVAQVAKHGAESGSLVAIDIDTGNLLALASAPTLDPNDPAAAPEEARVNRAVIDTFEPGSTSKVMTIAAALEEGVVEPDTVLEVSDRLKRGVKTFKDSHDHPTEQMTVTGILAESSNVGTILVGEQLPKETIHDYLVKFGIGQPGGLGLPGEARGILADAEDWDSLQPYTILFGQGVATTAVQVASVYQTMANGGVRLEPRLVDATIDPDGTEHPTDTAPGTPVVSEETADQVVEMMESVVGEGGTAPQAAVDGFRIAGKTGTAQYPDPECGCYRGYTASFAGVAPADDPQIAVAVMLHKPSKNGYYGGVAAAPVFAEFTTYALAALGVTPSGTEPPSLRLRPGDDE